MLQLLMEIIRISNDGRQWIFMYYNKDYFTEEDVKSLDKMLSVAQAAGKKVAMEFNSGWYLYSFLVIRV